MSCVRSLLRVSRGLVRVASFGIVILSLVLVIGARAAAARVDKALMDLGRHLLALSETGLAENSRGVVVNGQRLGFRAFTTDHEIDTVLDFFDGWCRDGVGDVASQERELLVLNESHSKVGAGVDRSWRNLTMADRDGDTGYVACIKHGIPDVTAEELGQRLLAFFANGNLRELGQFHYAAVARIGQSVRVVAVWTEGDFYPGAMFPAEGDAPGYDVAGISRPPSGRRMLSAGEIGHSQTLTIYSDVNESVAELAVFYRRDFLERGWRILADQREESDFRWFVVQRGSDVRVVSLIDESGERVSVTVAGSE